MNNREMVRTTRMIVAFYVLAVSGRFDSTISRIKTDVVPDSSVADTSVDSGNTTDSGIASPERFKQIDTRIQGNATYLAAGDLDSDGNLDLVSAYFGESSEGIQILLGTGDGRFVRGDAIIDLIPISMALADYDDDDDLDIVAVDLEWKRAYDGHGDGTFTKKNRFDQDGGRDWTTVMGVADFNNDGYTDIVTPYYTKNTSMIEGFMLFWGPDFLSKRDHKSTEYPLGTADIDGDGQVDLITVRGIRLGDGQGGFGTSSPHGVEGVSKIYSADIDDDGHLDLVFTKQDTSRDIVVLWGNGTTMFGESVIVKLPGKYPGDLDIADMDRDGYLDFIVASSHLSLRMGNNTVTLVSYKGARTFHEPEEINLAPGPSISVVAGDFDNDGKLDIASSNVFESVVSILLQR